MKPSVHPSADRSVRSVSARGMAAQGIAMFDTVFAWLRPQLVLVATASTMLTGTLVASALGFAFWWVAARGLPQEQVGLASTAVSAMSTLSFVSEFGLGTFLLEHVPRHRQHASEIIAKTLLVVAALAAAVGGVFVLAASHFLPIFGVWTSSGVGRIVFVLGVVATTLASVVDQAMLGLLRAQLQLVRNALFAAAKLAALLVCMAGLSGSWGNASLFGSWLFGNVVSLCWLLRHVSWAEPRVQARAFLPPGMGAQALGHHALNVASVMPNLLMPVIVSAMISADVAAAFYSAWLLVSFTFLIPSALASVLYTIGVREPARIAERLRFSLSFCVLASCAVAATLGLAGPLVLKLFGAHYAEAAGTSLRVLACALVGFSAKAHYIALERLRRRTFQAAAVMSIAACVELLMAILGAELGGVTGLSLGWTIGLLLVGAGLTPSLLAAAQGRASLFSRSTSSLRPAGTR